MRLSQRIVGLADDLVVIHFEQTHSIRVRACVGASKEEEEEEEEEALK